MSRWEWASTTLADCVATINSGVSVNSDDRPKGPGEIGVLKTSAVGAGSFDPDENKAVARRDRSRVAEPLLGGSVLFSRMNTPRLVGESCYVEADDPSLFLPDRLWQIRVDSARVDARWFSYALLESHTASEIKGLATGTSGSMKNISKSGFLGMRLLTPPIEEQRRIAEILAALDDQIRITQCVITKVALVKSALYQRFFDDSELARVPLGDISDVRNGTTPSRVRADYWERGSVAWLASGKVNDYRIQSASELITERAVSESNLRILPAGSVVIGMIGQGKTRGMSARLDIDAAINQNLAGVVPGPELRGDFLHHYLVHNYQKLRSGGRGSNQDALTTRLVSQFLVACPDLDVQARMARLFDCADQRLENERGLVGKLNRQKDGLLTDLVTGRVRIPEQA